MPAPATLPRARSASRAPQPVPPASLPNTAPEESTDLARRYHLILLDDNDHSYAYVIEMLSRLFGYGREKGLAIAAIVDSQGRAIVETADHDRVSRDQQRIHGFGADPRIERCVGSMSALVEEAV